MQQIDWSKAPEWAIGHVYQPWGYGYWVEDEPELGKFIHNWGRWWFPSGTKAESSKYTLELGLDYRTSLEFRPPRDFFGSAEEALRSQVLLLQAENDTLKRKLEKMQIKEVT